MHCSGHHTPASSMQHCTHLTPASPLQSLLRLQPSDVLDLDPETMVHILTMLSFVLERAQKRDAAAVSGMVGQVCTFSHMLELSRSVSIPTSTCPPHPTFTRSHTTTRSVTHSHRHFRTVCTPCGNVRGACSAYGSPPRTRSVRPCRPQRCRTACTAVHARAPGAVSVACLVL
jgi:hypothetical protein